jgi:hypothetical protein
MAGNQTRFMRAFERLVKINFNISQHLVDIYSITLKKSEKMPAARVSEKVVDFRCQKVMEWESLSDFDFKKNCVFIDETGFNLQ